MSPLEGARLAVARSYQYDLDGNRTRRVEGAVTTDVTYDRADQQISQVIGGVTRTFTYDRYGNLTQSADAANALTTYAYDEASRLTTITPPAGGQVSFTLDALDRHATRAVAGTGTTDTYAYLDATETAWQTGTGSTTSLLDADGSRLAVKTAGTVSWLVFDLHGSVVALCPAGSTTLTDAYRFDGWGQQIAVAGSAVNPFRYRGLLNIGADSLTGALLDMAARHYSPQTGTFTSQDSVQGGAANPLTMNRFLYALANPATLIDPDGHMAVISTDGGGYVLPIYTQTDDGTNCTRSCVTTSSGGGGGGGGGWAPQLVDDRWSDTGPADDSFATVLGTDCSQLFGHPCDQDELWTTAGLSPECREGSFESAKCLLAGGTDPFCRSEACVEGTVQIIALIDPTGIYGALLAVRGCHDGSSVCASLPIALLGMNPIGRGMGAAQATLRRLQALAGTLGADVVARLDVAGARFVGTNLARGHEPIEGTMSFFVQHAEGDSFAQALLRADLRGQSGTLYVTRAPCGFCVSSISATARSTGMSDLVVVTPGGVFATYSPETGWIRR